MGVGAERKTDSATLDSTTCPLYMTITLSTTCEKTYKSCLMNKNIKFFFFLRSI